MTTGRINQVTSPYKLNKRSQNKHAPEGTHSFSHLDPHEVVSPPLHKFRAFGLRLKLTNITELLIQDFSNKVLPSYLSLQRIEAQGRGKTPYSSSLLESFPSC